MSLDNAEIATYRSDLEMVGRLALMPSRAGTIVAVIATLLLSCFAAPAQADFGITSFDGSVASEDGTAVTQAGSHPFTASTSFDLPATGPEGSQVADGSMKNLHVSLPAGLIGNPLAASMCTNSQIEKFPEHPACSNAAQVGVADVRLMYVGGPLTLETLPVFSMEPPPGVAAQFAFNVAGQIVRLNASVRSGGDYGVDIDLKDSSQGLSLVGTKLTLWGVPSDPSHDPQRWDPIATAPGSPASIPRRPFVTLPTACAGPQVTTLTVDSWQNPGVFSTASFVSHDEHGVPVGADGCDRVPFSPSVGVSPTSTAPDAPTGLDVDVASPQHLDNPDGLASAQLRDVKVTLPEGMTINPAAAGGLEACSDEQLGLGSDRPVSCPDAAKIGTVTADTPLLEDPLEGGVYIRSQASNDPESGDMFRMALVLANPERGVVVKLPGAVRVSRATGRIVTEFKDNPQLPVERIQLHLKGGPRAPLATPPTCGSKTVDVELTSWAGHDLGLHDGFDVVCSAGAGGFAPSLTAGTTQPVGGAFSPFALSIVKPDGDAALTGLSLSLPGGLVAKLAGNLGTQVGTVTAFAGPGSNPFALPGKVFLEGPYDGAPYSLRVVVPAKAGPFDLGEVVVRQRIFVDPTDAHVTVVSDPLPTIVSGVPVRLQRLDVNVDRPRFIINPTSCKAKSIGGALASAASQSVPVKVRFQVGGCGALALKPKLALALTGRKQLTDGRHPGLSAVLTQKSGQANLDRVAVKLPLSLALDPDNADRLCEYAESIKPDPKCPASSIVGRAKAITPLLSKPLAGPVFFAKNVRVDAKTGRQIRTLPTLVIPLRGEVALNLRANSTVKGGRLVNTFATVPDAAVSRFELKLKGGSKGILVVTGKACKRSRDARVEIDGHNGKTADQTVAIKAPCAKATRQRR